MKAPREINPKLTALCRRFAAMNDADRAEFCATLDAELANELAFFAREIGESWADRSHSEIEVGLQAVGLANVFEQRPDSGRYLDWRDVPSAIGSLRNAVAEKGEIAHSFIERVAPLFPPNTCEYLRQCFRRSIHGIRFLDDSGCAFPQHDVYDVLFENPRLVFRLIFAVEAAIEARVSRRDLGRVWRAVWTEQLKSEPYELSTSNPDIAFEVSLHREIVVRLIYKRRPESFWNRWFRRQVGGGTPEHFRTVIEGFTAAYTPLANPKSDRMTVFRRWTQGILDWHGHKPALKK
jgi:hypothetical protein